MIVDSAAAVQFLRTAFEPEDWIAIFLKSYETGLTAQRVGPVATFLEPRLHAWLRAMNAQRFNVYVSVNAIRAGMRARTKEAIGAVRHVFVEADEDGGEVVAKVAARPDLPPPSYLIHSSPGRVHILWRAAGFTSAAIEPLQKHLSAELHTDYAATSCSQTTRLPGYVNHKYAHGYLVTVEYAAAGTRYGAEAFPTPPARSPHLPRKSVVRPNSPDAVERARRYLAKVEPAIAGQHGDLHTFKVCCRIVLGFALSDADALAVLTDWNARCEPPWNERDLHNKISRARKYGREPLGGLRS